MKHRTPSKNLSKSSKKGFGQIEQAPSENWLQSTIKAVLSGYLFVAIRPLQTLGPTAKGQTTTSVVKLPEHTTDGNTAPTVWRSGSVFVCYSQALFIPVCSHS
ncbi:hypothetical protein [Leptolyngbya sp. AN10]|uniref:hypothetical protein n=1 Tax=Leptolyngbya sp. AN10 TaxID=3423365 RepID=UPI003D311C50